jgi:soluble lytic murein transglycosylase-like protein
MKRVLLCSMAAATVVLTATTTNGVAAVKAAQRPTGVNMIRDSVPDTDADSVRAVARLLTANGAPEERAGPVAAAVLKYSRLNALDPLLVVGIIGVENATLVNAARSGRGATGVMQVMPLWKRTIQDCGQNLRDVDVNVCFGTRILRLALDSSKSLRRALHRYNGCLGGVKCDRYAGAVFNRAGRALLIARASL